MALLGRPSRRDDERAHYWRQWFARRNIFAVGSFALGLFSLIEAGVSELLEDHHTALMVSKPTPRSLAQRVLEMRQDSRLQWQLTDMARTEAYEYFSLTRFLHQHQEAYEQIAAGQAVQIVPPPAGAGLRFHGRG